MTSTPVSAREVACQKSVASSEPISRSINMPSVGERDYHLYIPPSLCNNVANNADTVHPLLIVVHCFGCTAGTMMHLTNLGDLYNFVVVFPEGLRSSFNAKYCCGYALENDVDDVGFISAIIDELATDLGGLVSRDVVYGLGWSNGGYMVTHAASLFRAIAPISGHIYNVPDDIRYNVVSSASSSEDRAIAIFMHHSTNDPIVHMSGCCTDPASHCGAGISKNGPEVCVSASNVLQSWATAVNGCSNDSLSISMQNEESGITCHTATANCRANVTLCTYERGGHFNSPSFQSAFPMQNEMGEFFARDACSINAGEWSAGDRRCACNKNQAGVDSGYYCLSQYGEIASAKPSSERGAQNMQFSATFCVTLVAFSALVWYLGMKFRHKNKKLTIVAPTDVELGSLLSRDLKS